MALAASISRMRQYVYTIFCIIPYVQLNILSCQESIQVLYGDWEWVAAGAPYVMIANMLLTLSYNIVSFSQQSTMTTCNGMQDSVTLAFSGKNAYTELTISSCYGRIQVLFANQERWQFQNFAPQLPVALKKKVLKAAPNMGFCTYET